MATMLKRGWQALRFLVGMAQLAGLILIALYLAVLAESRQAGVAETLIGTLMILVGSILGAAAVAALAHGIFANINRSGRPTAAIDMGAVFERYVTKFALVIAPVIASYGVIRILEVLR